MSSFSLKNQQGFTLLEVMVAVAILAMALAGIMHAFTGSLRGIGKADLYTQGVQIARSRMEEQMLKFDMEEGIFTGTTEDVFNWSVSVVRRETAAQTEYDRTTDAENVLPLDWLEEDSPMVIYEIETVVEWPDASYPGRVKLITLISRIVPEELEQEERS